MPKKFPKTRIDGTFCVVAKFIIPYEAKELRVQIDNWCKQWVAEHKEWHFFDKTLNYFDDFKSPPYVSKTEDNELWLRFDGTSGTYWWRDWFARLLSDLGRTFPELRPTSKTPIVENCEE